MALLKNLTYRDGKLYREGKEAGWIDGRYRRLKIGGKTYRTHRVVWEMFNGPIPEGMEIDHINHNRFDNRIENLRCVTHSENQQNQRKSKNWHFHKATGKWAVQININGNQKHLGVYESEELAELVHQEAREKYYI